ncbi:MAG TPA: hypothetical protein VGK02_01320 [Candidatus Aquicultor sp.]
MERVSWQIRISLVLIGLSAVFYWIQYEIFRDAHHIFLFLLGDIAFVFIEVMLVTVIIHELMDQRDKNARLQKLNIIIGAFFDEVGTKLLAYLSDCDPKLNSIKDELVVTNAWTEKDFKATSERLKKYDYDVQIGKVDLEHVRDLLSNERDILLRLLENPNILEHAKFTELLQAIFHLNSELIARDTLHMMTEVDLEHLAGDIKRVYGYIVDQWLAYMLYLKNNYPYLFSLAMRQNPFDQNASPVVVEA